MRMRANLNLPQGNTDFRLYLQVRDLKLLYCHLPYMVVPGESEDVRRDACPVETFEALALLS